MSSFKKGNVVRWTGTEGVRMGRKLKGVVEDNNGSNKVKVSSYNKNNNGNNIFNKNFKNTHPYLEITREKLVKNENKLSYEDKLEEILAKIARNKIPLNSVGSINNIKYKPMLLQTRNNLGDLYNTLEKNSNVDEKNKYKYKQLILEKLIWTNRTLELM